MTASDTSPRIVRATRPVSFRKRSDCLTAVVEHQLGLYPYSGVAVVFRSKRRKDQIKVLWCDGASLVVVHKRLERGRCVWPSVRDRTLPLSRSQFEVLSAGLDWLRMWNGPVFRAAAAG